MPPSSSVDWRELPGCLLLSVLDRVAPEDRASAECVCRQWHTQIVAEPFPNLDLRGLRRPFSMTVAVLERLAMRGVDVPSPKPHLSVMDVSECPAIKSVSRLRALLRRCGGAKRVVLRVSPPELPMYGVQSFREVSQCLRSEDALAMLAEAPGLASLEAGVMVVSRGGEPLSATLDRMVAASSRLRVRSLAMWHVTAAEMPALAAYLSSPANEPLGRLRLSCASEAYVGLGPVFQSLAACSRLTDLRLSMRRLDSPGALALARVLVPATVNATVPPLVRLEVSSTGLGDWGASLLAGAIGWNATLVSVDFFKLAVRPTFWPALANAVTKNAERAGGLRELRVVEVAGYAPGGLREMSRCLRGAALSSLTVSVSSRRADADDVVAFLAAFRTNTRLQRLSLWGAPIADPGALEEALRHHPALTSLHLGLGALPMDDVEHMTRRRVSNGGVPAGALGPRGLTALPALLCSLSLDGHALGDDGARVLADAAAAAPHLTAVSVVDCGLGHGAAAAFALLPRLIHLRLAVNAIGPMGAAALAAALQRDGCALQKLDVSRNALGLGGVAALVGALRTNRSLVMLSVAANRDPNPDDDAAWCALGDGLADVLGLLTPLRGLFIAGNGMVTPRLRAARCARPGVYVDLRDAAAAAAAAAAP